MTSPTYHELANSFALWQEYVDPDATISKDEFDAMGYEDRMKLLVEAYGPEDDQEAGLACRLGRQAA
jgi:hypothetical protein